MDLRENLTPQVNLVSPSILSSDTFESQQYEKLKQKIYLHPFRHMEHNDISPSDHPIGEHPRRKCSAVCENLSSGGTGNNGATYYGTSNVPLRFE
jgi:hypothetical protein